MLIVISPAKSLDFSRQEQTLRATDFHFNTEAAVLVSVLKKYTPSKLARLMRINPKLAQLNYERYQEWEPQATDRAKQALLSFRGDVFLGIQADTFSDEDLLFAQDHLRILSGLYGVLRPLDMMQAYRLEMGISMKFRRYKNLYHFWDSKIADWLLQDPSLQDQLLINLASQEYFKVLEGRLPGVRIITPVFKEFRNGEYKFIHVFGKKARGLMTRFIIDRKISNPEEIKLFDYEGYYYNDRLSEGDEWVFTRG